YLLGQISSSPNLVTPVQYRKNDELTRADWNSLWAYDEGDAIQIRDCYGNYLHGLSYGDPQVFNGGPDQLLLHPSSAKGKVFSLSGHDPTSWSSYLVEAVSEQVETPGFANNLSNDNFIKSQCSELSNTKKQFLVFPNPFDDNFNVSFSIEKEMELEFVVYDMLGKPIRQETYQANSGFNAHQLVFDQVLSQGVYYLSISSNEKILFEEKIICIR
ncbi:MAG: T9SS type A sorting domain-containing protein, partial [Bacteroidota bacterium]